MQYLDVLTQLNLLPATYLRPSTPFSYIQSARAAALYRYTSGSDGLVAEVQNFRDADGVWLDAWGKLFGVPRDPNEVDDAYMNRISAVLTAGRGTPVAIEIFVLVSLNVAATVIENLSSCSWELSLATALSTAAFQQLIANLKYVRPAGVPCVQVESSQQGGMFLASVDFLNAPRVTGAYLKTPIQVANATQLVAYTNNAVPLLPTTFLTDPTLNPGL